MSHQSLHHRLLSVDVLELYAFIKDGPHYEDRREYTQTDLKTMYNLSPQEADDLYYLIQRDFSAEVASLTPLNKCDPQMLKEGLIEALHSNLDGWDSPHDKVVIIRFIEDMQRYASNAS